MFGDILQVLSSFGLGGKRREVRLPIGILIVAGFAYLATLPTTPPAVTGTAAIMTIAWIGVETKLWREGDSGEEDDD